jgi:hypothetical protein
MKQQNINKKRGEKWAAVAQAHIETHTWDRKKNPLPKPLLCSDSICRSDVKPTCKTMIQPQYNSMGSMMKALVGEKSGAENNEYGILYLYNDLKMTPLSLFLSPFLCSFLVYLSPLSGISVPGSIPPGWTAELSWMDVGGVAKAVEEKRHYLDKKIIFMSDANTTQPLQFMLWPQTKNSAVWLCQVRFFLIPLSHGIISTLHTSISFAVHCGAVCCTLTLLCFNTSLKHLGVSWLRQISRDNG